MVTVSQKYDGQHKQEKNQNKSKDNSPFGQNQDLVSLNLFDKNIVTKQTMGIVPSVVKVKNYDRDNGLPSIGEYEPFSGGNS